MSRRRAPPAYGGRRHPPERAMPQRWRCAEDREEDVVAAAIDPLIAVARLAVCAPPLGAVFVDPITRERIEYARRDYDAHGEALLGVQPYHGAWVGTLCAALVLTEGATRFFRLRGHLGEQLWLACVAAHTEDAALAYGDRLGVEDLWVEPLSLTELEMARPAPTDLEVALAGLRA